MSYQAVLFAAGQGSRLTGLVTNHCKALLPVANLPMIYFPVSHLVKHGVANIIVVVLESCRHEVEKCLSALFRDQATFTYVETNEEDELGTVDSLKKVRESVPLSAENVILMSSDLVVDFDLHLLTDLHARRHSAITFLLAHRPQKQQEVLPCPGTRSKAQVDKDIIGLVRDSSFPVDSLEQRVVCFQSEEDLGKTLSLPLKPVFERFQEVDLFSDLIDAHLYIVTNKLLQFLCENPSNNNITMFKGEFLPKYINSDQFSSEVQDLFFPNRKRSSAKEDSKYNSNPEDFLSWENIYGYSVGDSKYEPFSVYAYLVEEGPDALCLRSNTVSSYVEINRALMSQGKSLFPQNHNRIEPEVNKTLKKSQFSSDVFIDSGVTIGDKTTLKRSIIGRGCVIGARVKITNSIIMDEVRIQHDCVIMNSILSSSVELEGKCELKDCIVESGITLLAGTRHKADVISKSNLVSSNPDGLYEDDDVDDDEDSS